MAKFFGVAAEQMASYLAGVPGVVASEDALAGAYFEMASMRAGGEPFAGMLLIDDRPSSLAQQFVHRTLKGQPRGEARSFLEVLGRGSLPVNGRPFSEVAQLEPQVTAVARDCMRLCDVLIVRSLAEYKRYQAWFGTDARYVRWMPARDLGEWRFEGQRARRIVVFAAGRRTEATAIFVAALAPLHAEIVVVSGGGEPFSDRATYLAETDPSWVEAVKTADCVIDAAISDPSWAYAFAARGVPLAYATTSGADEWVSGATAYTPASYRTILEAASVAIGAGPTSAVREPLPQLGAIHTALEATRPRPPAHGPLVSVVIPTYNRRGELVNNSLRSVLAQWYGNLEVIVVNDGGEKVGDLAELDPRIKVFDREVNVGANEAMNFGLGQATGKYVQMLGDDDAIYPDHVARLVEVLERTGYPVAHGNTLIRYEGPDASGGLVTFGYNAATFAVPVDLEDALASSPVAGQGMLISLEALRRVGFYKNMLLSDQELQMRLIQESAFLHVPHFSSEFLIRSGAHNLSRKARNVAGELEVMYAMHPSDNTYVALVRQKARENIAEREEGFAFPPVVTKAGFTV